MSVLYLFWHTYRLTYLQLLKSSHRKRKRMQNSEPALEQRLKKELEGEVRFDPYSKALYSTDASLYQIEPIGVIVPKHKQDVIKTIQIAAERKIPILPRGGGNQSCRTERR